MRLGHGTRSSPDPAGGASSASYSLMAGRSWKLSRRRPAPSSVTVARYSPAAMSYCVPVSGTAVSSVIVPFPASVAAATRLVGRPEKECADGAAWGAGDLQPRRQLHHSCPAIPPVRTSATPQGFCKAFPEEAIRRRSVAGPLDDIVVIHRTEGPGPRGLSRR